MLQNCIIIIIIFHFKAIIGVSFHGHYLWGISKTFQTQTFFNTSFVKKVLLEMLYLNSTLNFGIPPVLVFQLEVYYEVDRLLTGLTAQRKGTTARWYSNKTSLLKILVLLIININSYTISACE